MSEVVNDVLDNEEVVDVSLLDGEALVAMLFVTLMVLLAVFEGGIILSLLIFLSPSKSVPTFILPSLASYILSFLSNFTVPNSPLKVTAFLSRSITPSFICAILLIRPAVATTAKGIPIPNGIWAKAV